MRPGIDDVTVTSTDALAVNVARFDKLVDDALRGPFGNANRRCDIPKTDVRVAVDRQEHLRVTREKVPLPAVIFWT